MLARASYDSARRSLQVKYRRRENLETKETEVFISRRRCPRCGGVDEQNLQAKDGPPSPRVSVEELL